MRFDRRFYLVMLDGVTFYPIQSCQCWKVQFITFDTDITSRRSFVCRLLRLIDPIENNVHSTNFAITAVPFRQVKPIKNEMRFRTFDKVEFSSILKFPLSFDVIKAFNDVPVKYILNSKRRRMCSFKMSISPLTN